ncbi:hypothetical protein COX23_06260 [Candidatus Gottesmanbacteria bacterium CG23_combo_of_CG06-09_8_20_14_all_37_19]|uniref:SIS domain-containing protein n=1 Tax=Candidatus Gottesmanbacteria bacterium CG1_02_37_22 TaxID=1805209 RepID=A0A1J4TQ10_9BACT|nr:MAG: hypothetical protein AUJ73_02520 [Candidatus Gottesmanbacteria bacterium CG1_02_37_22]PIP32159.1 MAG: hypothetical protein COX23_06260 [Candidatus Gottesmanbacteria bacterium CG23_combo_of_CG06-09_8_20_14_all_37_19]
MHLLDDTKKIDQLNTGFSYDSIYSLPDQCAYAWNSAQELEIPSSYSHASSILFCGMGGSSYGARIIKSLYSDKISIPIDIVSDYHLPKYIRKNVLIVAASYSGNTEETISCIKEALQFDSEVIGISNGGELFKLLKSADKPVYKFDAEFNPSKQPRLGQGYMQMGQIAILKKLNYIEVSDKDVQDTITFLKSRNSLHSKQVRLTGSPAKQYATFFENRIINIIGAGFLEGAIHAIRNPFNETSKHFANYFILPEANHHLMEGLSFPKGNKDNLCFLMINSPLYEEKIKKRMELTKEVIQKNNIPVFEINLVSKTKLAQIFELIQLGSFITFYLGMLHQINPADIPWVNYFKEKLK